MPRPPLGCFIFGFDVMEGNIRPTRQSGRLPAGAARGRYCYGCSMAAGEGLLWAKECVWFFRRPQNVFIITRLFCRQYGLYSLLLRDFYVAAMIIMPSERFQTASSRLVGWALPAKSTKRVLAKSTKRVLKYSSKGDAKQCIG